MSQFVEVENNKIYTGFDALADLSWCTPEHLGCKACITAATNNDTVSLTIAVDILSKEIQKTFTFDNNQSFTWTYSLFTVVVSIADFQISDNDISFNLDIKLCIEAVKDFGNCISASHQFSIPTAAYLEAMEKISNADLTNLLVLHALQAQHKDSGCNCR